MDGSHQRPERDVLDMPVRTEKKHHIRTAATRRERACRPTQPINQPTQTKRIKSNQINERRKDNTRQNKNTKKTKYATQQPCAKPNIPFPFSTALDALATHSLRLAALQNAQPPPEPARG